MEMNSLSVESPGNNRQLLRWTPCPELGSVASDSRLWRPAPVVSSVDVPAPHLRARQCQESTLRAARWPRTQGMSIRGSRCVLHLNSFNTQKSAPQPQRDVACLPPPSPRIGAWEHCSASLRAGILSRPLAVASTGDGFLILFYM